MRALTNLGPAAILGLVISGVPFFLAVMFAMRPTAARLELMRPLSLAGLLAAGAGLFLGAANSLIAITRHASDPNLTAYAAQVFAESTIPAFMAFASLAAAWLLVAIGMRRASPS
jgi:hypothetical protein